MDGIRIIKAMPAEAAADEPKVIKRESYAAMMDAITILETAREQARAILRDAEAQKAAVLEAARREGEEQGRAEYVRGMAEALDAMDRFYARAEPEIVRLSMAVARKIIGEEIAASPDTVCKIAREALFSSRRARRISIKVNAADAVRVRAGIARLELASSCEVDVLASEGVGSGGCVIETEFGIIDARLETQLRLIEHSLIRAGGAQ